MFSLSPISIQSEAIRCEDRRSSSDHTWIYMYIVSKMSRQFFQLICCMKTSRRLQSQHPHLSGCCACFVISMFLIKKIIFFKVHGVRIEISHFNTLTVCYSATVSASSLPKLVCMHRLLLYDHFRVYFTYLCVLCRDGRAFWTVRYLIKNIISSASVCGSCIRQGCAAQ